jgi:hypothetical protein
MGGRPRSHNQLTSPLKRAKGTTHQSIKHSALMVDTVTINLTLISCLDGYAMHLQIQFVECWSRDNLSVNISAIAQLLHMPRARGRPRRGAAWYAYDSRRKRQKKFERALALASARATRKHGRHRTPPMAYVEEVAPDEPIQNCPEHLLFTVPDNWNPPTTFGNETKLPAPGTSHRRREEEQAEDFTICYVQEELSGSSDEKANPTSGPPPETTTRRIVSQQARLAEPMQKRREPMLKGQIPSPLFRRNGRTNLHTTIRAISSYSSKLAVWWMTKSSKPFKSAIAST